MRSDHSRGPHEDNASEMRDRQLMLDIATQARQIAFDTESRDISDQVKVFTAFLKRTWTSHCQKMMTLCDGTLTDSLLFSIKWTLYYKELKGT